MFTHTLKRVNSVFAISVEAGLPNITGKLVGGVVASGPFNKTSSENNRVSTNTSSKLFISYYDLDVSLSNPTYGNSETVTPKSLTTFMLIKY